MLLEKKIVVEIVTHFSRPVVLPTIHRSLDRPLLPHFNFLASGSGQNDIDAWGLITCIKLYFNFICAKEICGIMSWHCFFGVLMRMANCGSSPKHREII